MLNRKGRNCTFVTPVAKDIFTHHHFEGIKQRTRVRSYIPAKHVVKDLVKMAL